MNRYIYKITNSITKKIYVGQRSCGVEIEKDDYYGSGKIISESFLKYGIENFTKEILEQDIQSKRELDEREIYWIAFYNSDNLQIGYNLTKGGDGGDTFTNSTEESKERRRKLFSKRSIKLTQEGIGICSKSKKGMRIIDSFPEIKEKWKVNHSKAIKEYSERCKRGEFTEAELEGHKKTSLLKLGGGNPRVSKIRCIETGMEFDSIS